MHRSIDMEEYGFVSMSSSCHEYPQSQYTSHLSKLLGPILWLTHWTAIQAAYLSYIIHYPWTYGRQYLGGMAGYGKDNGNPIVP